MKIPLKNGDEHDALTKWKRVNNFRPGVRKGIKRTYNKRFRRIARKQIQLEREREEII